MTTKTTALKPETTTRIVAGVIAATATLMTLGLINILTLYCATGPAIASAAQWVA